MLIGEVARRSGVSSRMLRHYDAIGLVRPTGRTTGGYREYSEADIERLFHVESLRSLGLSLREAGRALDDPGFAPGALMADLIADTRARMAAEARLLERLEQVDSAGPGDWESVLGVISLLHGVRSDDPGFRQRAALASAGGDLPAVALVDALTVERDENVAGALRWALSQSGDGGLSSLAARSGDPDPEVRRRVIAAIGALDTPQIIPVLRDAVDDPDSDVRRHAALALGARGEPSAIGPLVELVAVGDRDVEAAEVLGEYPGDPSRIVEALTGRLGTDPDPAVRMRLVQALAEISGAASTSALSALTRDPDVMVARTAEVIGGHEPNRPPTPTQLDMGE
ncbi:MerR family transcriptional regulator [Gordonia jinghuaiqii]|uniref:HEAT repeat domain-containing protein n=1 Tax=Gordonia jinghuaiqii TaxID=2758710 RepID=A0A7D7RSA5_9ACTN|nr:HEAT repeat domain-containing protein [Gordonia jinghuaiqii]MCR5978592.1 MerR family transcriptional regulator [Gordonia jinghuaiqii]QMT02913.1 HEAT repeat domain-containing protein [Gordonia jinghuaiqii]